MYRQSMKNLQVDYIDYYLIHGAGLGTPVLNNESSGGDEGAWELSKNACSKAIC